ncbi:MAG: hypothetical protein A2Y61_00400 [Chloroflexi bacterium RBG_13_60_13]|nr:MAG: hypothetical protein A2Y61_00400 [Chloroflexi bacterium RBG_13_60_13]
MATKPKRTPVRRAKKAKKPRAKSSPKVRKDPIKEYQEAISKDGVVEALTLADDDCLARVKLHISTQSLELDRLLNGRGVPCGRMSEIIGPPHIGKSTLLDHLFAEVQRMGGIAILADTEGARDANYSRNLGVDLAKLQYLEFGERAIYENKKIVGYERQLYLENVLTKILESIIFWSKNYPDIPVLIGFDALAGTSTREELENRLSKDEQPAAAARVLRKICRQFPQYMGNTKIALVVCNHEYQNILMGKKVGKARESYGGDAIRHLASIRLSLWPAGEWVKRADGEILGRVVGAKLVKNRLGNPWGEAKVALLSGVGINNVWSVFEKLKRAGIIATSGSWAALNLDGEEIKFQGWNGLMVKCQEDETLFPKLVSVYQATP